MCTPHSQFIPSWPLNFQTVPLLPWLFVFFAVKALLLSKHFIPNFNASCFTQICSILCQFAFATKAFPLTIVQ